MVLATFLRSLRSRAHRPSIRRLRRGFVPQLTLLEDRTVPSTLTVTSPLDDGSSGTLRAVIAAASPGSTITFADDLKGDTITLEHNQLTIDKTLDIEGPGAKKLTISGGDARRIFDVAGGASLTLSGLTIAHGRYDTTLGGGILTFGGGGILNEVGATLTLVDDTLSFNQAVGHQTLGVNGQDEFGGALFNLGTATVSDCTFTHNQVLGGGDANSNLGGSAGGAIDNYDGATLTVTDSLFKSNQVVSADGVGYFSLGGAIENNAGTGELGDNTPSTATLTDCTFLDNLSQAGALNVSNGGAIVSEGTGTVMTLSNCLISGNLSVGGDGGVNNQGDGRGLMNEGGGTMNILDCTITDNEVVGGANGDVTKSNLSGGAFGGGIQNLAHMVIAGSTITGNIAQGTETANGPGGIAFGGGITTQGPLTMTDTVVSNNIAIAGPGGALGTLGTHQAAGFAVGGGIGLGAGATATLVNCTIADNLAQGSAGRDGRPGGDGIGGGVGVGFSALRGNMSAPPAASMVGCTITGNQAVGGAGGAGANGGDGLGGGLAVVFGSSATLTDCSVKHNDALGGEEGHGGSDGQGVGGGAYVFNLGTLNHDGTTYFKKNHASTSNDDIFPWPVREWAVANRSRQQAGWQPRPVTTDTVDLQACRCE
jgi:hypothetical protein